MTILQNSKTQKGYMIVTNTIHITFFVYQHYFIDWTNRFYEP